MLFLHRPKILKKEVELNLQWVVLVAKVNLKTFITVTKHPLCIFFVNFEKQLNINQKIIIKWLLNYRN